MVVGKIAAASLVNRIGLGGLLGANAVSTAGGVSVLKNNPTIEQGWQA